LVVWKKITNFLIEIFSGQKGFFYHSSILRMKRTFLAALFCCAALLPQRLPGQTLYQDAMAIYEFRQLLEAFDVAFPHPGQPYLIRSRTQPIEGIDANLGKCITEMCKARSGAAMRPYTNVLGAEDAPSASSVPIHPMDRVYMQQAVAAFYDLEQYVRGSDGDALTNECDPAKAANLLSAPASVDFLPQINSQLRSGLRSSSATEARPTGGMLSMLTGGIPEAAIIQGIVDWTVQRAKEELMRAFLQNWLAELEGEPVLKAAFPKSLDLLATTDLTTIISQGGVWKAAFEEDLRDVPTHLPAIFAALLDHIPASRLNAAARMQIMGAVRVASGLYVQLQQKQKLNTAILTTSATLLQQGDSIHSYAERGLLATSILLKAVQYEEDGALNILRPQVIQNLSPGQFDELWNLLVVSEQPALAAISQMQPAQLDIQLAKVKAKAKSAMLDIAAAAGTLQQIRQENTGSKPSSDEDRFQEANAYFNLVADLLEEGMDFVALFGVADAQLKHVLDAVIRPLGNDLAGIAEGISTKQYGFVVTNLISSLRLLASAVVQNPATKDLLVASTDGIVLLDSLRSQCKRATQADSLRAQVDRSLRTFHDSITAIDGGRLAREIDTLRQKLQKIAATELDALKKAIQALLKEILGKLQSQAEALKKTPELDEIAEQFNTYGRFMVNVLTAENSADVKEAFEEAAMKTGSYMVKQSSKFSATLTFLPGFVVGRESPSTSTGGLANSLIQPSTYTGASLPIGLEFAVGTGCKGIGAVGLYAQVADLGAVLSFRLRSSSVQDTIGPDTVAVTNISPEIGFRQVLAPGLGVVCHVANAPITFGARMSYAPLLRSVDVNGNPGLQASMVQVSAFIAVDVTVFQLYASRKKCRIHWKRISE
jgi:hypothetical protein